MEVLNEYQKHHYIDEYEKCDLFCPHCGKQSVWQDQSDGDYYVGEDYICVSCSHNFTIQGPRLITADNKLKMLEQLISGKTLEPTTPRGN